MDERVQAIESEFSYTITPGGRLARHPHPHFTDEETVAQRTYVSHPEWGHSEDMAKVPQRGPWIFLVVTGFLGNQHTSEHTADLESQAAGNGHWMTSKVEPKQPGFVVEHRFPSADSGGRPHSVCIWF